MSKQRLKFDYRSLKYPTRVYREVSIDDGYGGSSGSTWELIAEPRASKKIKNRTSQAQIQGGSFDFYQVYEFIIRTNPDWSLEKDNIVYCDDTLYVIRGIAPFDNNPLYTLIVTETINDSLHALWDIINSNPIEADYETIIQQ